MNFVADESVEMQIIQRLRTDGHDCFSIQERLPGIGDDRVFEIAAAADRVLMTSDTDFGELVFRLQHKSAGVVLLRIAGLSNQTKAAIVSEAVQTHAESLQSALSVVEPGKTRVRPR